MLLHELLQFAHCDFLLPSRHIDQNFVFDKLFGKSVLFVPLDGLAGFSDRWLFSVYSLRPLLGLLLLTFLTLPLLLLSRWRLRELPQPLVEVPHLDAKKLLMHE